MSNFEWEKCLSKQEKIDLLWCSPTFSESDLMGEEAIKSGESFYLKHKDRIDNFYKNNPFYNGLGVKVNE